MAHIDALAAPTPEDWQALRDWAAKELEKRREDARREVPLYAASRAEAHAAVHAAEMAYGSFVSLFSD